MRGDLFGVEFCRSGQLLDGALYAAWAERLAASADKEQFAGIQWTNQRQPCGNWARRE